MNKSVLLIAALSCTSLFPAANIPTIRVFNGTGDQVVIDYQTAYGIEKKWEKMRLAAQGKGTYNQVIGEEKSEVVDGKMVHGKPWNRANIQQIKYYVPSSYGAGYMSWSIDFRNVYPGKSLDIVISPTVTGYASEVYSEGQGETGQILGKLFAGLRLY